MYVTDTKMMYICFLYDDVYETTCTTPLPLEVNDKA